MRDLQPGDTVRVTHGTRTREVTVLRVTERGQVLASHGKGPGLWYAADGRGLSGRGRITGRTSVYIP